MEKFPGELLKYVRPCEPARSRQPLLACVLRPRIGGCDYPTSTVTIQRGALQTDFSTVVEQITGRDNVLNHNSVPAACFTHPEISMVGLAEPQARALAEKEGYNSKRCKDQLQSQHQSTCRE